jgi:pimeloyl-ACP methyl ester carboxylesterase
MRAVRAIAASLLALAALAAQAQEQRVVDIPTRAGVTQRFLYVAPAKPKAAAILFAGGAGQLGISADGAIERKGNFLVRSRGLFTGDAIAVAVLDPPSDRRDLTNFRETPEHVADVRAVIAWLRRETHLPVWLVGTSRGTQSAAYAATQLQGADAPDGLVLTSSVLAHSRNMQEPTVLDMPLDRIAIPVLVVHHREDGCRVCPFEETAALMRRLSAAPRKELIAVDGGVSQGDPCEAFAHHGYNGIESEVVARIAGWMAP